MSTADAEYKRMTDNLVNSMTETLTKFVGTTSRESARADLDAVIKKMAPYVDAPLIGTITGDAHDHTLRATIEIPLWLAIKCRLRDKFIKIGGDYMRVSPYIAG